MGAEQFYSTAKGKTPRDAFKSAHADACYEYGHGGYSGTLAEKGGYTMSNKPDDISGSKWSDMVDEFDEEDKDQAHYRELKRDFEVYDDKWGDALCIENGDDEYIFCGWASS